MYEIIFALLAALPLAHTAPVTGCQQVLQTWENHPVRTAVAPKKLHGRFLHITDLHADPFYKIHSSTGEDSACHRGSGSAGTYGAETSDCDSPYALINETFKWIEENLRDTVDFVVWTGDSARHDSDEDIPRSAAQVLGINEYIAGKFTEVFGTKKPNEGQNGDLIVPIVPNFGNNDILPHNIMLPGPNKWLKLYGKMWRTFIPEEQRHGFEKGGWFYVEVIPQKLAVFSLNTLYFFDSNSAVDGCALRSEPGFEQMEWLRIQLAFMRNRGMKAILMGHVPPARTGSKQLWDETCWQKYTLWLQQYRDVVITGLFGHMNVDHFILQDTKDIDLVTLGATSCKRTQLDDDLNIESAAEYLEELRQNWASLPKLPAVVSASDDLDTFTKEKEKKKKGRKHDKSKKDKAMKKVGGPWGERYQMSSISPSLVPNFFPTLRVIEYNITGLIDIPTWLGRSSLPATPPATIGTRVASKEEIESLEELLESYDYVYNPKMKSKKKPRNPDLKIPSPPTKGTPPGPAYSPQTFTLIGYTQYFANLTQINNDYNHEDGEADIESQRWHKGKHNGKIPKEKEPHPKKFKFEIEYSTFNDTKFKLPDMTVKSYLNVARKIGKSENTRDTTELEKPSSTESSAWSFASLHYNLLSTLDWYKDRVIDRVTFDNSESTYKTEEDDHTMGKKHKKKKKKTNEKAWIEFLKRAFVSTMSDDELKNFQVARIQAKLPKEASTGSEM